MGQFLDWAVSLISPPKRQRVEASTQACASEAAFPGNSEGINLCVSANISAPVQYADSRCAVQTSSAEEGAGNGTATEIASKPKSLGADPSKLGAHVEGDPEAIASPTFGFARQHSISPVSPGPLRPAGVFRSAYTPYRRPFFRTSHTPVLLPRPALGNTQPFTHWGASISTSFYDNVASRVEELRREADMLENVRNLHSRAQHAREHSMEAAFGAERGKLLMQGTSPDAVDNLEHERYKEHLLNMKSWDRQRPSEGIADQRNSYFSAEVAREEKAQLQGARERSCKEWEAAKERLKDLGISAASGLSLQRASREEERLTSELARLAMQRKTRAEQPASPESERPESVHSEEQQEVTDDEVVLLSDSDEDEAGDEEEEEDAEASGDEEERIEEHELYQPDADDSGVRPLSPHEMITYQRIMSSRGPEAEVLVVHPIAKEELLRKDFIRLAPGTWLSDESINMYMRLLQQRDTRMRALGLAHLPKCHFFSSFFFNKLYSDQRKYNYQAVQKWTRAVRLAAALQASKTILDCDKIFVPIHQPSHWCMAVIDLKEKCLRYYDSMHGQDVECLEALACYIRDEAADKAKLDWDTSTWRREFPDYIPAQRNGYDCGMFAVKFADYEARGRDFTFTQADMPLFRKRMVSELFHMLAR